MSSINPNVLMNISSSLSSLSLGDCGLQGKFPKSIFRLPNLRLLNLGYNWELNIYLPKFNQSNHLELLDLSGTNISGALNNSISNLVSLETLALSSMNLSKALLNFIGNLVSLKNLDLSHTSFSGALPDSIGNLVSLKDLDRSYTSFSGALLDFIGNLVSLKNLDLSHTSFSGALPDSIGNLVSLKDLDLSYTSFSGALPNSIGNLVSLKVLDLSSTNFSGALPNSIGNLVSLEELNLGGCNFSGIIPRSLGNLSQLNHLGLSNNYFSGQIPSSLTNLTHLEFLDIFYNQLEGSIPNEVTAFPNLIHLHLSFNFLNGTLPSWLYTTSSLKSINLQHNQLSGYIKQFQHISLEEIFLQNNKLQGLDPSSMSQLVNLTSLDLSSNNLSGIEESDLFSKVQNLQYLDLSNNNLYFNSNHASADYTLPNLQSLDMSSCNVNQFPQFLRGSKVLRYLDLSNNRIHDKIPKWMWDIGKDSLQYLNLSHNSMTEVGQLPWKNIRILDLSSNLIQGDPPIPPLTTSTFLISNNNLNGEMSDLICNVSYLEILDMSHNHLSGIIPQCFGKLSKSLRMLNLGTNKLHGTIPATFAKGCQLENLNLNANQLEGPLTRSILNCRSLQVLDLGNNKINATFPHWLGNLQELKVLVMKSNQMHGSINGKKRTHYFRKLQILDLSNNSFTGQLPTGYIENFKAMMNVEENRNVMPYIGRSDDTMGNFYSYSVHLIEKGLVVELMKIFATLTIIDLSNNKFEGEIPRVIGNLSSVIGLNLSHNYLIGHIPPSFGNLINLEWLDLSSNKLDGKIPEELLNLTMLSSLNLSTNELVGHIPEGKQFNTFENSSYEGNDGLCGFPLSRDCSSNEAQQPPPSNLQEEDGSKSEIRFGWKVVLIGYMSGFMFGVGMGYAVFRTGQIPLQISHLSKLVSLDLSWNDYQTLDERTLGGLVQNLTEVRQLFLDGISMSSVNSNVLMNISSSLSSLSLGGCGLQGKFPKDIFQLPNLKLLNLEGNWELNIYLPKFNQSNHLELLDLSGTNISEALPNSISNLVSLETLALSSMNLSRALLNFIGNLVSLEYLDLSFTNLSGALPDSIGNLVSLKHLDLHQASLSGALPNSIGNLVSLEHLDLSFTNLSGALPNPIRNLRSLKYLSLSGAPLCPGLDPSSISQLVNLTLLDLSSNNLSGIVESVLFSKLQNLQYLDLSYNNLYFNSNHTSTDYTLPNLYSLYLSSCNVNQFPQFLRGSKVLKRLDLSNNRIYGKIPKWMWDVGKDSLFYLNLSHNSMTELEQLPWKNIQILDLSSNLIQGDPPIPPLTTSIFLISNNNLNGQMSDLICNVSYLEILDMSHNHLSGIIPQCFGKLSKSLRMLNLGTNKLHGTIPATFAKGCQLENLNLNANQLEGPLTRSILNCRSLQVLDLGNNKINATFLHWLGTLQELKVLVMKSNQMHGSINGKMRTHYFRKLQILDLSNNSFTGQLPTRYIENFNAMMNVEENTDVMPYIGGSDVTTGDFYSYSVHLIEKGQEVELMKIFATLTIIDLSNNKFEGEIPTVIGKLSSIIGLNLSHNYLVGHIPPSFGNLINLEWLDLSSNKLDGKIPEQLLNLTMLSSLNLSKNELVGHIPEGKQFNTFENSSYEGNDGLCGFPLSRDCSSNEAQQPPPSNLQEEDGSKSEIRFGWKVVLIGYMSGFMFGVGMGYAVFRTADAFQDIAPFATSVLDGYNVCILLMDRQGQEKLLQWRVQKKPVE
ncbi:Leucine-rich repeat - like 10 [Theobroma cacao]|nr:Leucine-rich repeat - like 10 [Theobroma cacao]